MFLHMGFFQFLELFMWYGNIFPPDELSDLFQGAASAASRNKGTKNPGRRRGRMNILKKEVIYQCFTSSFTVPGFDPSKYCRK